jgi:hypothetical protein
MIPRFYLFEGSRGKAIFLACPFSFVGRDFHRYRNRNRMPGRRNITSYGGKTHVALRNGVARRSKSRREHFVCSHMSSATGIPAPVRSQTAGNTTSFVTLALRESPAFANGPSHSLDGVPAAPSSGNLCERSASPRSRSCKVFVVRCGPYFGDSASSLNNGNYSVHPIDKV